MASKAKFLSARTHVTITGHDSNVQDPIPDALFAKTAGAVSIIDEAGVTETYTLAIGAILPMRGYIIKSTGLTATLIGFIE
jgi:hypothetical protein